MRKPSYGPPSIAAQRHPACCLAIPAFQAELGEAQRHPEPKAEVKRVAARFVQTNSFIRDPTTLPLYAQLKSLGRSLDLLEREAVVTRDQMVGAIQAAFGEHNVLQNPSMLDGPKEALKDSIVAVKLLPDEQNGVPLDALCSLLRLVEVICKMASTDDFPGDGRTLKRFQQRSFLKPSSSDLRSSLSGKLCVFSCPDSSSRTRLT